MNAMSRIRWSPSSLESSHSPFAAFSDVHWSNRVELLQFCYLDCRDPLDDDVFQRNEKLLVRQRRDADSEVQRTLKHQFLDCGHLFFISDLTGPVPEFVFFVDECPQDVVELFHVFG